MAQLTFEGTVYSGSGAGKHFVNLPWVRRQIQEKLGFTPYSGTLNLRLTGENEKKRRLLDAAQGLAVKPEAGYCPGALFKATIDGLECAVVIPKVPNYPADILEIIAPLYLRGNLGLTDSSTVAVMVTF